MRPPQLAPYRVLISGVWWLFATSTSPDLLRSFLLMRRVRLMHQSTRTRLMYATGGDKICGGVPPYLASLTLDLDGFDDLAGLDAWLSRFTSAVKRSFGPVVQLDLLESSNVGRLSRPRPPGEDCDHVPKLYKSQLKPGDPFASSIFARVSLPCNSTVIERVKSPLRNLTNQMWKINSYGD